VNLEFQEKSLQQILLTVKSCNSTKLRASLRARPLHPHSAFTLNVLKQFQLHNLESKKAVYDYIAAIWRLSDNSFTADTVPKPGSEKDLDPKKTHFERHPWGLSAGVFSVDHLQGLEVFWCKKTGSIPLVCAHKKSNNCQNWEIFVSCD
jgi:hypothetical protein